MASILGIDTFLDELHKTDIDSILQDAARELQTVQPQQEIKEEEKQASFLKNPKLFAMRAELAEASPFMSPAMNLSSPALFGLETASPSLYPTNAIGTGLEDDFFKSLTTDEWLDLTGPQDSMVDDSSFDQLLKDVTAKESSSSLSSHGTPQLSDASPAQSWLASPADLNSMMASMLPFMNILDNATSLLDLSAAAKNPAGLFGAAPVQPVDPWKVMKRTPELVPKLRSSPYLVPKKDSLSFIETSFAASTNVNPDGETFTCPHAGCGKKFNMMRALLSHQLSHTNDRPHACKECDAKFRRLPDLQRHIRSLHSENKPYACPHGCGKSFPRSDALKRHLTIKSKAKASRYGCPILQATVKYDD